MQSLAESINSLPTDLQEKVFAYIDELKKNRKKKKKKAQHEMGWWIERIQRQIYFCSVELLLLNFKKRPWSGGQLEYAMYLVDTNIWLELLLEQDSR